MTSQKTVILAWTHKVSNLTTDNVNNFWGIGDLIRGTIQLYQLSKKYNFELVVDVQHHPISSLLKERTHDFSDFVHKQKDNIPFIFPHQVENLVSTITRPESTAPLLFITTDYYHDPITEDCKDFIKEILTPNDEFQSYMQEKDKENPYFLYRILHYRIGDAEMVRGENQTDVDKYMKNIIKKDLVQTENVIFLSDSNELKQTVKRQGRHFTFNTQIGHTGYHDDAEKIRDTMFEFFTMIKATKIKSYTVNNWPSGFVKIAKDIYGVSTECITCINEKS